MLPFKICNVHVRCNESIKAQIPQHLIWTFNCFYQHWCRQVIYDTCNLRKYIILKDLLSCLYLQKPTMKLFNAKLPRVARIRTAQGDTSGHSQGGYQIYIAITYFCANFFTLNDICNYIIEVEMINQIKHNYSFNRISVSPNSLVHISICKTPVNLTKKKKRSVQSFSVE